MPSSRWPGGGANSLPGRVRPVSGAGCAHRCLRLGSGAGSYIVSRGLLILPGQTWERLSPTYFLFFHSTPRDQQGHLEMPRLREVGHGPLR